MPLELNEIELKRMFPDLIDLINKIKEEDTEKLVKELKNKFLERTSLNINVIKYIDAYINEDNINMITFEIFGVYDLTVNGKKFMEKRRSI